jgi:nucleotide-binding universal stress UspA family protein
MTHPIARPSEVVLDAMHHRIVDAMHHRIVAGFDGSIGSAAAAEWAAREAIARGSPLQIVMAQTVANAVDYYGVGARRTTDLQRLAARFDCLYPTLALDLITTVADPRDALLTRAQSADLLVIGSHESGAARRLLFGSVERTAARRSPCPVVVVTGRSELRPIHRIVVGVDGSSASDAALIWAAREADLHRAELVVIHAWDRIEGRTAAHQVIDTAMGVCASLTKSPVRGTVLDGDGVTALTMASMDADLLAIGSRGRSGFRTMLFGSVALAVAERSSCPVAVTHPQPRC